MRPRHRLLLIVLASALLVASCGGGDDDSDAAAAPETGGLEGLFKITGGQCQAGSEPTGSFFKMVEPDGKLDTGPFVENADSPCDDKKLNPLLPGTDGGMKTGALQPQVSPPFDATGNGLTGTITSPVKFFGVTFAVATNEKDPQTETTAKAPSILVKDGQLSGDVSAFAAAWNNQHFNQGVPKPNGEKPGLTAGPTGTYDEATKAFTLEWSSQIVGGPFNNFTGIWHFEGEFEPANG